MFKSFKKTKKKQNKNSQLKISKSEAIIPHTSPFKKKNNGGKGKREDPMF